MTKNLKDKFSFVLFSQQLVPCCSVKCIRQYQSNTTTTKRELNFNGGHKKTFLKKILLNNLLASFQFLLFLLCFTFKLKLRSLFGFLLFYSVILSHQTVHELFNSTLITMSLGSANENRGLPAGLSLNNRRGHSWVCMSSKSCCDAAKGIPFQILTVAIYLVTCHGTFSV